ncbi:MAG: NAD-dependent epimerase/dehydratase family protein [Gemmatimonadota bacterium]|nr:NAD-dependent epimerase/dehydratase family protein [Gemmatimonadota bacterium]
MTNLPTRRDFVRASAAAAGALTVGCGGSGGETASRRTPSDGPLDILILGGTGFIGPHEVEYARSRGHALTLFNRGQSAPEMFPNIEQLRGDRGGDLAALEGRAWDVVIDNSGFYPRHARLSARLLADSVDRYLFVSSISAYDQSLPAGVDEYNAPIATMEDPADESDSPYGPTYGPRKALCEAEIIEAFGEDRSIIVRPGLITGPGDPTDRIRHWLARFSRQDEVLVPGYAGDPVQLIDARDMTGWMVRMLENGDTGIYNAVGPDYQLTMDELVNGARSVVESEAGTVWVSDEYAIETQIAGLYSPWIPASGPRGFMLVNNGRALGAGLEFRPLREILTDMLAEYRERVADDPDFGTRGGVPFDREAELIEGWRDRQA